MSVFHILLPLTHLSIVLNVFIWDYMGNCYVLLVISSFSCIFMACQKRVEFKCHNLWEAFCISSYFKFYPFFH